MDITMSTREVLLLLLLLLLIVMTSLAATASASFGCDEVSTCRSLVGYKPKNRTTLGAIQTLFNVSDVRDIAGANGLPDSTPRDHTVGANHTIRIPLECGCYKDEAGILWSRSKNPPKYKIKKGDTFYLIGLNVFSGLVDYRQIQNVNPDAIPTNLTIGEEVIIPFLCGCGRVNEKRVAHYGMTLEKGTTIQEVARQEGSTVDAVLAANSFSDSTTYNDSETVLDIPLPVCSTMVRNDSLDYPLLVPNGTYMYTANGCVKCKCDAANNWTLHCEPSNLKPTNWFSCPSMQCRNSRNMYIGNTTSSGSDQVTLCAYAGYGNQTIFTTLATEPTPPVNRKRKKKELMSEIGSSTVASTLSHIVKGTSKDGKTNQEMQRFNFESIVAATDNFSIENKLGEGGFGPVYKRQMHKTKIANIKRTKQPKYWHALITPSDALSPSLGIWTIGVLSNDQDDDEF
ncbi:lysM domain-containing GPI-anchored protein 2-like [Senna tora]|uniref:LysM domain-containing GPI-anchored protein 2-like n=1 Tax=Senna tora TaxID=362788 RepID=A0A834XF47_9FABA|nr:lysM domain-containing GPI-anchored protein 2-like [Senna tora]